MVYYSFSERMVELIERFVYVTLKELKQPNYNFDHFDGSIITFGFLDIEVGLGYDDTDRTDDDIEADSVYIQFNIGQEVVLECDLYDFQTKVWNDEEFYKLFEQLKKKVFKKCKLPFCKQFTFSPKEDYCKLDYIYNYEREDICCICLENNGSWTKLSCGHFIHTSCFQHLQESNQELCPLCKEPIDVSDMVHSFLR